MNFKPINSLLCFLGMILLIWGVFLFANSALVISEQNNEISTYTNEIRKERWKISNATTTLNDPDRAHAYYLIEQGFPDPTGDYQKLHDEYKNALTKINNAEDTIERNEAKIVTANQLIEKTMISMIQGFLFSIIGAGLSVFTISYLALNRER